jgi:sugar phosphate permease
MLRQQENAVPSRLSSAEQTLEQRTMRRVSVRLMPLIVICYFVAFLDRQNVSFAALQMNHDLGFTAASYGFGAGVFFLTYCLCEVPSNLLLYRFGARRWIARILLSWGLCAAGTALITGTASFYTMRALLGVCEAGFQPGVLYFLTLWFPAAYRGRVLGIFIAAIPLSGMIGAPLSGWLLSLDGHAGLRGWQWLFLLEGLPAVLLAPIVAYWLQDAPAQAHWLQSEQRAWLISRLQIERVQRESKRTYSVWQALSNPWVLYLAVTYFSNVALNNGIAFFLPTIVRGFGLSTTQTGLVVAIPSAVACICVLWWGRRSDTHQERYGHAALANFVGGAALLLSVQLTNPVLRMAAMVVAVSATLSFAAVFWAIPASFLSGASAAGGIAAISGIGILAGFLAPWFVGYMHDLSGSFRPGLGSIAVLAMIAALAFYLIGRRRTARGADLSPGDAGAAALGSASIES